MNLGFEIVSTAAKPKRAVDADDAPTQTPMRPVKLARNPSTDQKKVRRQIQRKSALDQGHTGDHEEGTRPMSDVLNTEAELLAAMAVAPLERQRVLAQRLDDLRMKRQAAVQANREVDLGNAIVAEAMTPVAVHSMHTTATDWITEVEDEHDPQAVANAMLAEASLWFGRTTAALREDRAEFAEQAQGTARRLASQYGTLAPTAKRAFLDYVAFLHRRTATEGGETGVWPSTAEEQAPDVTPWTEKVTTGDAQDLAELPAVSSAFSADEFAFIAADADKSDYPAHEQAGYAESGLPDEPTPGDEEPFDAKINGGDAVLDPTGPVDVHPPMPGAGEQVGEREAAFSEPMVCGACGRRWNSRAQYGVKCPDCGAEGPVHRASESSVRRHGAEEDGHAESDLEQVEVGDPNDRPMWPWELPTTPGDAAADVASVPTPGDKNDYPQPRNAALDAFVARVRAGRQRAVR